MTKSSNEQIMEVVVEMLDTTTEEAGCTNSTCAVRQICNDVWYGDWELLILHAMKNMSMAQFMKIKEISLGEDYPDYAAQYKFCKCENK